MAPPLPSGWSHHGTIEDGVDGRLLLVASGPPEPAGVFRTVWLPPTGEPVWDAEIDALGYVRSPDGRRIS